MTAQSRRRSTSASARPGRAGTAHSKKSTPAPPTTAVLSGTPTGDGADPTPAPPAGAQATPHAPVRVPSAYPLDTGLVDYGLWVEMFSDPASPPPEAPPDLLRGRIWA